MQIPSQLTQFKHKNIGMLVTGKQDAVFYHIHDGVIDEKFSFVTPWPTYSDNEGVFQAATNGRVQSGSIELHEDEDMIRDFLHELKDTIKNTQVDFAELYVFAPSMSRKKVVEALPRQWQERITRQEDGNYVNESPLVLLEKLAKKDEQPFTALNAFERKILSILGQ